MSTQPTTVRKTSQPRLVPDIPKSPAEGGIGYQWRVITFLILLAAGIAALWLRPFPSPIPATAPAREFSAERAAQHVSAISRGPHATGTSASDLVRGYIVNELTRLGAEPRIQEADLVENVRGGYRAVHVRNIIGKLAGQHNTGTVLLVAHYDSTPTSLGAADDGAGVATLLETTSALRAGKALDNDVVLLFTDAEELGTKGAEAFHSDPEAKQVKVVLNFEARGTSGRSVMFESRGDDGWLIRGLISMAPHVWASSLAPALYQLTNNDTDYTRFKREGVPGLNFAFAEGWQSYHTGLDRMDQLDLRSLQHHGSYALSMARYLGNLDLAAARSREELVYFNLAGPLMVVYSSRWALPFSLFALLAFIAMAIAGVRKARISLGGMTLTFLLLPLVGVIAVIVCRAVLSLLYGASRGLLIFEDAFFVPAVVLTACSIYLLLQSWVTKKRNPETAMAGGLLWWVLLSVVTGMLLKGASFVFTWPALCCTAALSWTLFRPRQSGWQRAVPYLLLLPAVLMLVPVTDNLFSVFLMVGSAIVAFFIVLGLPLFALPLNALANRSYKAVAGVFALAVLLFAAAFFSARPSGNHPMFDYALFSWDADAHKGTLATQMGPADGWTAQMFGAKSGTSKLAGVVPAWFGELPAMDMRVVSAADPVLSPPEATRLGAGAEGDFWRSTFRIRSTRNAPELSVKLAATEELVSVLVNGKPAALAKQSGAAGAQGSTVKQINLDCIGDPGDGWTITVTSRKKPSLKMEIADRSYDLPYERAGLPRRPATFMADRFTSDSTFVSRSYSF